MRILAVLLLASISANAEELPIRFEHQYTDDVKIVLTPDVCDKSNVTMGWIAYAENSKGERAEGCWLHESDLTVLVDLKVGEKTYLDYHFYKDKFKPVY